MTEATDTTETDLATYGDEVWSEIKDRLIHTLTLYPQLSPTMLQVGIGTGTAPKLWHPVLDHLIESGVVDRRQVTSSTPRGRNQVYTIISLAPTKKAA